MLHAGVMDVLHTDTLHAYGINDAMERFVGAKGYHIDPRVTHVIVTNSYESVLYAMTPPQVEWTYKLLV